MDTTQLLRQAIGATWFGAGMPADALGRLAAIGHPADVPMGAALLAEGEPTAELGLVLSGRVALTESLPGRGPVTLLTVEPGDIYGWSVLLAPYRATSTVTAVEASRLVRFPGPELRAALRGDPALAAAVHHRVLDAVARRLLATRQQLLDVYRAETLEPGWEPW